MLRTFIVGGLVRQYAVAPRSMRTSVPVWRYSRPAQRPLRLQPQLRPLSAHREEDGNPTSVWGMLKEIWDDRNVTLPVNEAQERMREEQDQTAEDKFRKENPKQVLWNEKIKPLLCFLVLLSNLLIFAYELGSQYYTEWKHKQDATCGDAYRACVEHLKQASDLNPADFHLWFGSQLQSSITRQIDEDGKLLLHHAAGYKVPVAVVLELMNANDLAARAVDHDGMTPLHYGMGANAAEAESVVAILEAHPQAARIQATHTTVRFKPSPHTKLENLVQDALGLLLGRKVATIKAKCGLLPLHCGLINGAATESLMPVLDAYPEGAQLRAAYYAENHFNRERMMTGMTLSELPIVVGMRNGRAAADALLAVFQAYPDAALGDPTYEKQETLLHYAMAYKTPGQLVEAIVNEHPEAAKQHNDSGKTPLRCGLENQASAEAIAAVLKVWPDAAKEVDPKSGMLPLHSGLAGNPDEYDPGMQVVGAVIAVLNAHPEATQHRDKYGKTPLHYAVENDAPAKLVAAVRDAWPRRRSLLARFRIV